VRFPSQTTARWYNFCDRSGAGNARNVFISTLLIRLVKYQIVKTGSLKYLVLLCSVALLATTSVFAQRRPPPQIPSTRPARLNVQYHRAETAWKSGNSLLEAKARIDRVLKEMPADAQARKLRAGIHMSMGHPDKALVDARAAAAVNPFDGEAHLLQCEAGVRAGANKAALDALNRSAGLLLDRSTFHVRLSRCAVALQQYNAAEAYARTAVAGNIQDADAYLQLARVFVLGQNEDKAVTVLERGMKTQVLNLSIVRQDSLLAPISDRIKY